MGGKRGRDSCSRWSWRCRSRCWSPLAARRRRRAAAAAAKALPAARTAARSCSTSRPGPARRPTPTSPRQRSRTSSAARSRSPRSRRSRCSRPWPTARSTPCSRTGSTSPSTSSTSTRLGTVVMGGPLGVTGHIGWFIPKYLMDEHPEFKTWEGLKGQEELFKTPESGDQGMFLGGDPSYVQKDKELIEALDLNLKHVTAGAEPAQVARWSQLYKQQKPVLFYWYSPQYLYRGVRPRRGQAAAAYRGEQGLPGRRQGRRRPRAVQVRVRRDNDQQALQQEVRRQRLARLRHAEEDEAHEQGPGLCRQGDRRREGGSREGRPGLGGGERRHGRFLAAVSLGSDAWSRSGAGY